MCVYVCFDLQEHLGGSGPRLEFESLCDYILDKLRYCSTH